MSRCVACNSPIHEDYEFLTKPDLCHRCSVIVQIALRDRTPIRAKDFQHEDVREGVTLSRSSEY